MYACVSLYSRVLLLLLFHVVDSEIAYIYEYIYRNVYFLSFHLFVDKMLGNIESRINNCTYMFDVMYVSYIANSY